MTDNDVLLPGSPKVLVVDDEEIMRDVAVIIFEDHGAQVIEADDGLSALEMFRANLEDIEIVCMDFSMPNMDGYETYIEMRKLKQDFNCVFISGLEITPEVEKLRAAGEVGFVGKPFKEAELIQVVRELRGANS